MPVYCAKCRHLIPWGRRPGSTGRCCRKESGYRNYNSQEECASSPRFELVPASPLHPPIRKVVNSTCRAKNRDNDCREFLPRAHQEGGFWARLLDMLTPRDFPVVDIDPPQRPGYNPPPVQDVVKPPAPEGYPGNVPRPEGAEPLKIKPPPTFPPQCERCKSREAALINLHNVLGPTVPEKLRPEGAAIEWQEALAIIRREMGEKLPPAPPANRHR